MPIKTVTDGGQEMVGALLLRDVDYDSPAVTGRVGAIEL
jgi:hypothetical protein